jgi:hypothetical protein
MMVCGMVTLAPGTMVSGRVSKQEMLASGKLFGVAMVRAGILFGFVLLQRTFSGAYLRYLLY